TFVRTVYGFGYQFIAAVTVSTAEGRDEPARAGLWLILERRQIPLMEGDNVIGRGPDAAIHIDSPGVSRHHARILVANGEVTLEDLGSKNGTELNGGLITARRPVCDGDRIRLGAIVLTLRISSPTSPTETVP